MNRALIVFNPLAGDSGAREVANRADVRLRAEGWRVEVVPTRDRGGATEIVRKLAGEIDLLVIAGGDGSLREAIEGLEGARDRVTVGFLPLGNANVAAQELGIPADCGDAIELLCNGEARAIDLGRVHMESGSRLFLAMVGVGWDAITVRYVDRVRHTRIGRVCYRIWADAVYVMCGLLASLHVRPTRFSVSSDEEHLPNEFCAAHICNFKTYGKDMSMAPDAYSDSGYLHYQLRKISLLPALVWHLVAAQRQVRVPACISTYGKGCRMSVHSRKPLPFQIDGDFLGEFCDLEVEILAQEVRILVPKRPPS